MFLGMGLMICLKRKRKKKNEKKRESEKEKGERKRELLKRRRRKKPSSSVGDAEVLYAGFLTAVDFGSTINDCSYVSSCFKKEKI